VRQVIPRGPVASQEAIKQLGTNGGGFFNANGASPFENPTGLTNFLSIVLILCIPVALTYTFGKMVGSIRQGAYLARNAGKVCTRQMILENVWGPGYGTESHYLKVYAYRIRRKLGDENGLFLQSDPAVGYRLAAPAG
jgi:K+-transporting ATPase A subunit